MGRRAACLLLLAVLGLGLAACSSTGGKPENPNSFPANYRKELVATLRTLFKSNDTVRITGAVVSEPALTQVDKDQRYVACVRYTAHGINPGEIGNAMRIAYFYGGHLNQLIPAAEGQCVHVVYKPFPELNQYCVGVGCQN